MATFDKLGLSNEILKALSDLGFKTPTDIQVQAIPKLIFGEEDFIGLAQTGTGKTAAFGLPLLERIDSSKKATQALILAPTRELGQQITEQLKLFSKYLDKINVLAVYGGASITNQIKALKKPQHIIIATPGRLIDLIKRKCIHLEKLKFLVLDEADEMLNMGFKIEIDKILSYAPDDKLTWLFSATMPPEIKRIVQKYMDAPVEVRINEQTKVNTNIEHQFTFIKQSNKTEALTRFLDTLPEMRGLVFCRTKRDTQDLAEKLMHKKYRADAIHGDLSQQNRDRVMRRFKSNQLQVLIATDVAARGIDVNDISHVFHYTLPDDSSYYTHRSGRTARAGKKGISISFVSGSDKYRIHRLEKQLGIKIQRIMVPGTEDIADIRIENWCHKILNTRSKENIDPSILEKAHILLGNLSKEEIVEKVLINELHKLNLGTTSDLNETPKEKNREDRSHKRKGHRNSFKGKKHSWKEKGKKKKWKVR